MSQIDCSACESLQNNAPAFVQNGVTNTVCNYLKKNRGLGGSNDNCEDMSDALDCLIGKMAGEVESYDVCEWKHFAKDFVENIYEYEKAEGCSLCGLWGQIEKLLCMINFLQNGIKIQIGEDASSNSYIVAGDGVSYLRRSPTIGGADVELVYIAGGLAHTGASLDFHTTDFVDADGRSRSGNAAWGQTGKPTYSDELIYEIRWKKSAYPAIKSLFIGHGQEVWAGSFKANVVHFQEGRYAFGQHGRCDQTTGEPISSGMSSGHLVPEGWVYTQCRMLWIDDLVRSGSDTRSASVSAYFGMRVDPGESGC